MKNPHYGDDFQRLSKYTPDNLPGGGGLDWTNRPATEKSYPEAPVITLPKVQPSSSQPLDQLLARRRSIRSFSATPLSLADLSYLLWAANGVSRRRPDLSFRTAPSAGALYPIETYLVSNCITQLPRGLYHYQVSGHYLEQLRQGDLRAIIANAALGQRMCADAAAVFVWTAVFPRSKWKYRQRAYRYVYLDAGHIAENLALAATALELGSCQIAALFDDMANDILQIDGTDESVIYMTALGHIAEKPIL